MKNTMKAIALALVLSFTATIANAKDGIIISDRGVVKGCDVKEQATGIIVVGMPGIIVVGRAILGIIVSDKADRSCTQETGIIVSDRTGIIISD